MDIIWILYGYYIRVLNVRKSRACAEWGAGPWCGCPQAPPPRAIHEAGCCRVSPW